MQNHDIDNNRTRDEGTPELAQRHIIEVVGKQRFNRTGVPIDYYLHQRWIKLHLWEAAQKLYAYWYFGAEKCNYATVRDPREPRGNFDPYKREQMEESYKAALASINRTVPRLVVFNVVCMGEWLAGLNKEAMAKYMQNPTHYLNIAFGKNKRMALLIEGLEDLAKHFKLKPYDEDKEEKARATELA